MNRRCWQVRAWGGENVPAALPFVAVRACFDLGAGAGLGGAPILPAPAAFVAAAAWASSGLSSDHSRSSSSLSSYFTSQLLQGTPVISAVKPTRHVRPGMGTSAIAQCPPKSLCCSVNSHYSKRENCATQI